MTVLYFGIYKPDFSRNRIYMRGLRENGVTVLECRDESPGLIKFWRLWRKHRALRGRYDIIVVGYAGHLVVPFARLISRKPIVADMLGSLGDAELHSHTPSLWRKILSALVDRIAIASADVVLLESAAQKVFFAEEFGDSPKYRVLYTGADETVFHCNYPKRKDPLIVLFRGRLTPESGILHILRAAEILKYEKGLRFRVLAAGGPLLPAAEKMIAQRGLSNVHLISKYLSDDILRESMCDASISLGQFEDNPRLSRTIPHKAFESFAMGIPYISGDAAIREIGRDGDTCFFIPLANPGAIAKKIMELYDDPALMNRVGSAAKREFEKRFSSKALGAELSRILHESIRIRGR